jgi:2'-5' RNA ligase
MHGIVSLLDDAHYERVEQLWADLAIRFGLRGIYGTPYPHFSYHVAVGYDLTRLEPVLQAVAEATTVFTLNTSGIGMFNGDNPVLYMPVVRTAVLSELHERVWTAVAPHSSGAQDYYSADNWMPHITLAHHDLTPDNLAPIVAWLNQQNLTWQVTINNLSLIFDDSEKQTLHWRFELTG